MRYRIKAYTLSPKAKELALGAVRDGVIDKAEVTAGFVQGTSDLEGIQRLASQGITVRPLGEVSDEGSDGRTAPLGGAALPPTRPGVPLRPSGAMVGARGGSPSRAGASSRPTEPPGHYLVSLNGSLTRQFRDRLEALGATLIERDEEGRYVARITGDVRRLRSDPDIASVQAYGVRQTLRTGTAPTNGRRGFAAAAADRIAGSAVLEAVLHPGFDAAGVASRLTQLGAEVMATTPRVIRFVLAAAPLEAVAGLQEIAEVNAPGVAGILHDIVRPLVGLASADGGGPTLPFRGEGEVVGICDTGLDVDHPDFTGRVKRVVARGRAGDGSDPHGHGTHVAGTVAGDGTASGGTLAGMAPAAQIVFQSVMDVQGELGGLPLALGELFQEAYDEGVRVHNNSWGAFLHGRYSSMSFDVDRFVHENPDFLPVIAAGNDGSCRPGTNVSGQPGFVDWPSMSAPASAKNGLTVGASRSARTDLGLAQLTYGQAWPDSFTAPPIGDEHVSGDPDRLAGFSGRGPCDDMRVKPDVVAPGTDIASTRAAGAPLRNFWGPYPRNPRYAVMGGTSMACPVACGLAVLVRQYYRTVRRHPNSSAALLKATIVNGATPLTGADAVAPPGGTPSYHQGFGRIDAARTIPDPATPAFSLEFVDQEAATSPLVDTGHYVRFSFEVEEEDELRVCLAWTDLPGRALQNGLLMQLEDPTGRVRSSNDEVHAPVGFEVPDPLAGMPGMLKRDPNNNLHVIRVPAARPGPYVVSIVADNLLAGPQSFALVLTGPTGPLERLAD